MFSLAGTKSSSEGSGRAAAQGSQKKRPRSGNVPLAPPAPRGQARIYGIKVVAKAGKTWYRKHTESSYFSDVCVDRDNLLWEFPQIVRWIQELQLGFIFQEPDECNLSMVCEFYVN